MPRQGEPKKDIEQYDHPDKKRKNNPPVGLVTPRTDRDSGKKTYAYDPHMDPALQFDSRGSAIEDLIDAGLTADSLDKAKAVLGELKKRRAPYLNWAGKAEHTSFEVSTVSLHVHERIDPKTIIEAVRVGPALRGGPNKGAHPGAPLQISLFERPEENLPLRDAIDFYKHDHNWSNRLIAGDSLLVMNSLLEKEGLAGKVQMVYIDPPYGIRYGSNFQPFVNKRDVKDGKDEDLTQEPEMIRAFRDTWELGIHSYLTYLRDRLLLARELLHEGGSCFVQIDDENVHLVRCLYKTVPHITLKSIANNEPPAQETLYDQPYIDTSKARVTGPFTVEAVPAPVVRPITPLPLSPHQGGRELTGSRYEGGREHTGCPSESPSPLAGEGRGGGDTADASVARTGLTLRHAEWRDELLKTGVRGKHGQMILFSRVEPLSGTRWLHADAETRPNDRGADSVREGGMAYGPPQRVVISFGPEHAPLEQRQVEMAWEEVRTLSPKPSLLIFAAFQFDPEAAKDINELTPEKTGMTFLKVQMNTDLLTDDLKKKRAGNQSFWLIGQPDVQLRRARKSEIANPKSEMYVVEVHGFDYYNIKTGAIESGEHKRVAVKIVDDRGIESLKIVEVK